MPECLFGWVGSNRNGLVLSLAAKGRIRFGDYGIASDNPATLRVGKDQLVVELHRYHGGQTVALTVPNRWRLSDAAEGTRLSETAKGYALVVPQGTVRVRLVQ